MRSAVGRQGIGALAAVLALTIVVGGGTAVAGEGDTLRVSVDSDGTEGNDESFSPAISGDGRYVVFSSVASNLVSGDTNGVEDVFVHDRMTGVTARVSVSSDGAQGNDNSESPAISDNGRYVVFDSFASNLVAGDGNGMIDVFVHDRETGTTRLVSVNSIGDEGNAPSYGPTISADGRYIAFESDASNLVSGDGDGTVDVFVHDRDTGITNRVPVNRNGILGNTITFRPAIAGNGRHVTFFAPDATGTLPGDVNGAIDVFVYDRDTGTASRVSVDSSGSPGNDHSLNPKISADGRYVTFQSVATNLVAGDNNGVDDVFVHDRNTGNTSRVSVDSSGTQGNDESSGPTISADGRYVTFQSVATNLVAGDNNGTVDVFVHDRDTGTTSRVSVNSGGIEGNDNSFGSISADASYVAFESLASNLVPGDGNDVSDVFVHQFLWFVDDDGHLFEADIEAIATIGITRGCNPPLNNRFCPDDQVTRGQMAAFLTRALDLEIPEDNPFVDTVGSTFERDIQALAAAGITRGCNPPLNDRFCPNDDVTRGQMAALLTRALDLEIPEDNPFVDTVGSTFERDIRALAAAGITKGCNPPLNNRFCPEDDVTRGQMAAFLNRGLAK